jgi:1H-pyrrole-2-carbonyl-[peptidyl-carrier protein] chlorinase
MVNAKQGNVRLGRRPRTDSDTDVDVVIIGGGPAGSVLASLLAQAGHSALVIERDIHPREHVGESLTPSTTPIFERIGVRQKMEDAGFVHKGGACWTAPRSPIGKFLSIRLAEFPMEGATQSYTYNVERDDFDAMLLRNAYELGATVLQGVRVAEVLFEQGRAVGVRAKVLDGWEREIRARVVVDASGRRCMLASQLGLKKKDDTFNQFGIYSWYRGLPPAPPGAEGMLFLHFLDLERAWAWQIPLRNGIWSIGMVTDKADFHRASLGNEDFFESLIERNDNFAHVMRSAERIRGFSVEGDYSYKVESLHGKGWLLIGDALRFVDPVFSTGVDVATYSALYAFEAIDASLSGAQSEDTAFADFDDRVSAGVAAWHELISIFYRTQNLFTYFAVVKRHREKVVRILQGNLYQPESLARAKAMIDLMNEAEERVHKNPDNLLRPGALRQRRSAVQA